MTFWEYELRMKAHALQSVDDEYMVYLQAWTIREAQAKKKKGKHGWSYVYKRLKDFFDYDSRINEITQKKKEKEKISSLANRLIEHERGKRDGEL